MITATTVETLVVARVRDERGVWIEVAPADVGLTPLRMDVSSARRLADALARA